MEKSRVEAVGERGGDPWICVNLSARGVQEEFRPVLNRESVQVFEEGRAEFVDSGLQRGFAACISKEVARGAASALDDSGPRNRTSRALYLYTPRRTACGRCREREKQFILEPCLGGQTSRLVGIPFGFATADWSEAYSGPSLDLLFATLPGRFSKCQVVSI